MQIYVNSAKKTLAAIKAETGADYIINGGLFSMSTWKPVCHLKVDGKTLASDPYAYWGYGWNDDSGVAMVNKYAGHDNYICCVAMVKDGASTGLIYNSDLAGTRGRSAIGIMPDGRLMLYCTKDGSSLAKTPEALQAEMISLGVQSAIMLDGGGSSQCDFDGQTITSTRKVHNLILVWTEKDATTTTLPALTRLLYRKTPMMSGDDVKALQTQLNALCFPCGTADGWLGDKTSAAIKEFQKAMGLTVDGVVGPATWIVLGG